jgi:hypothetical protein
LPRADRCGGRLFEAVNNIGNGHDPRANYDCGIDHSGLCVADRDSSFVCD